MTLGLAESIASLPNHVSARIALPARAKFPEIAQTFGALHNKTFYIRFRLLNCTYTVGRDRAASRTPPREHRRTRPHARHEPRTGAGLNVERKTIES
jgi:hypothetical protein